MPENEEQIISVGEAAYLKHLEEMATEMKHQTQAGIANAFESLLNRVCKEIDEAKANDGN